MSTEQNNTTNYSTVVVTNEIWPSPSEFFSNLTPFVTASIFIALLVLALNLAIYATTLLKIKKHLTSHLYLPTSLICSIYPLISFAALVTVLLPKSWLICHTIMHLSFTFGAIVFHNLCFRYAHSEVGYLKAIGDQKELDLQTSPCCCCCVFLPKLTPKKTRLFVVKCLIWQMPFVQSSIMIASNVLYYMNPEMYEKVNLFFSPFLASSICMGLWGLNITVKMINKLFPDYNLMKKLFSLQLILLLCKLQYLILDSTLDSIDFGGVYPINNIVLKKTTINLLILVEMSLVSLLVRNAYSKPSIEQ